MTTGTASGPSDLKVEAQIWPEVPVAGETFTASVTIDNRFADAVTLVAVVAVLPAELELTGFKPTVTQAGNFWSFARSFISFFTPRFWSDYLISRPNLLDFQWDQGDQGEKFSGGSSRTRILQPGSSIMIDAPMKTKSWLLATPRKHKIDFWISYKLGSDPRVHSETVPVQFDARPALQSVAIGAVLGAFFGSLAQELLRGGALPAANDSAGVFRVIIRFAVAMLLGGIGVIFVSRRTAVQALPIGVEDFWGGFLTGFLVGWFGSDFFKGLLPKGTSTTPTPG